MFMASLFAAYWQERTPADARLQHEPHTRDCPSSLMWLWQLLSAVHESAVVLLGQKIQVNCFLLLALLRTRQKTISVNEKLTTVHCCQKHSRGYKTPDLNATQHTQSWNSKIKNKTLPITQRKHKNKMRNSVVPGESSLIHLLSHPNMSNTHDRSRHKQRSTPHSGVCRITPWRGVHGEQPRPVQLLQTKICENSFFKHLTISFFKQGSKSLT